MILSRIANSLVRQDWPALFAEFVLVIVGILIALQLDNWNSERIAKSEEGDYLTRLVVQLEETRAFNEGAIAETVDKLAQQDRAYLMLLDGKLTDEAMPEFEADFQALDYYAQPKTEISVMSELIASGKVSIIGDAQLRAAVTEYQNAIDVLELSIVAHFEAFLQLRERTHQAVRLRPGDGNEESIMDTANDLVGNDSLRGIFSFSRELNAVQLDLIRSFHAETLALLNQIKQYVNKDG